MNPIQFDGQIIHPEKIVCIGKNYHAHIAEMDNETPNDMVVFSKPNTAISEQLYFINADCHFETELCFLIKNGGYAGVSVGFDLTKRAEQNKLKKQGLPWERAKAFDRSAIFAPFIPINFSIDALEFTLSINGTIRQHGAASKMIYNPDAILRGVSDFMQLRDNDVIMSGTPEGVSGYALGDCFEVELRHGDALLIAHSWTVQ